MSFDERAGVSVRFHCLVAVSESQWYHADAGQLLWIPRLADMNQSTLDRPYDRTIVARHREVFGDG